MARAKRTDSKGRVLRVGEMQRSEDGRYLYRYTDLVGKKRTVYANDLAELRVKEEQIQRDLQDGIDTSKGDMTLNNLFRLYMETKKNLRATSIHNYNARWRCSFEEALGGMKISKVKQLHIATLIAEMVKSGAAEGTIKSDIALLSSVLEMAVESDLIRKNPCKGCGKYITGTKKERKGMSQAEQAAFVEYTNSKNAFAVHAPMFEFMLATGLRIGETVGLTWENVDLKENVIHIRQQLIYNDYGDGYKFHIQELKTEAGYRDIPLTAEARKSLIRQLELCLSLGWEAAREEVCGVSDFVFINREGKPHSPSAVNQVLRRIINSYNNSHEEKLPQISAHILRHTFCSRMAEAGMDAKVLSTLMGHNDVALTLNRYTHLDFTTIQESVMEAQEKVLVG